MQGLGFRAARLEYLQQRMVEAPRQWGPVFRPGLGLKLLGQGVPGQASRQGDQGRHLLDHRRIDPVVGGKTLQAGPFEPGEDEGHLGAALAEPGVIARLQGDHGGHRQVEGQENPVGLPDQPSEFRQGGHQGRRGADQGRGGLPDRLDQGLALLDFLQPG